MILLLIRCPVQNASSMHAKSTIGKMPHFAKHRLMLTNGDDVDSTLDTILGTALFEPMLLKSGSTWMVRGSGM